MVEFITGFILGRSVKNAEKYIKLQMIEDNGELGSEDIKIYECRDSKLEKILK